MRNGDTFSALAPSANVAYLVTSYRLADQVARLVATLRRLAPKAPIVVRHDFSKSALDVERLISLGGVRVLPRAVPVEWGDFSYVQVLLDAMRDIRTTEAPDWLVVISGQDYPLRPLDELHAYLAQTPADAILEESAAVARRHDRGPDMYRYRYHRMPRLLPDEMQFALERRLADVGNWQPLVSVRRMPRGLPTLVGFRSPVTPFGPKLPPRKGSNWLVLRSRALDVVLAHLDDNPGYVRHFRHTLIPSEAFFHTILLNHDDLRIQPDYVHFERWERQAASPAVLGMQDLPAMLQSRKFFARKFDTNHDALVLDELDAILHRIED